MNVRFKPISVLNESKMITLGYRHDRACTILVGKVLDLINKFRSIRCSVLRPDAGSAPTETGKPLSELKRMIPEYAIVKRKYEPAKMDKDAALKAIQEAFAGEKMDLRDGIKLLRGRSWIHVRKSNTEPILRTIAEAPTKEEAEALLREVIGKLH